MPAKTASRRTVVFTESDGRKIEAVRYTNPDGSAGGWVAPDFQAVNVTLGPDVIVYPGGSISSGAIITGKCMSVPH